MSQDSESDVTREPIEGDGRAVWPLPGIVFIGLYMLVLAAAVTFGAIGKHLPLGMLALVPMFATASFGLLRMLRWAWALALGAVFLMMTWYFWILFTTWEAGGAVMGGLNLVLFLYLIRPAVRMRLR